MTPDVYMLGRIQRLELVIAQQNARIRQLEQDLFAAEARLAAVDDVVGVPA